MDEAPPVAVVLDEAVELAKTYSTDGSPAFVNGVLSAIADDVAHEEGYAGPGWDRTATASTTPW